jgi:hypothetical protein
VGIGVCTYSGAIATDCGNNTGLYLSPQRGSSLLLAFRFWTADNCSLCDPYIITVEGSNKPQPVLPSGSSWTLIYNGSSGLQTDPGRYSFGQMIWLSNNIVYYSSYRILIVLKRGLASFVQYSEVELFGF